MSTPSLVAPRAARLPGWGASVVRRVFSFPAMLAALLPALAVLTVRARFDDPDMWWHLRMGEIIAATHRVPTTDIFSYTTHHHSWVPHEWLSQLLIYSAYRLDGYTGLMLWLCVFTAGLLIAGYALCSLYSGNAKVAFLGALVLWLFSTVGLAIRPQMVGYLLLVFELLLLHLGGSGNPRWFFWLPPLFALWVNCHGSFFLGLAVAAVFLLCSYCDFRVGALVSSRWPPRHRRLLGLALLLSLAALFLNPVGVKQILYPLNTMLHQPIALNQVDEWLPLRMNSARGVGLLGVLAGVFLLSITRQSELYLNELLLLAMGTWLAVSHQRMLFVFGILAAPIVSRLLAKSWEGYNAAQDRPWANAVFIAVSLLIAFWVFPGHRSLARQVEEQSPVKAVEFIESHHLSGPMLNDYVYGGYLIWAAPEHPVFVDGRGDVFEWAGVLSPFAQWATLRSDPNTLLDQYGISFCLLSRGSPMARVLPLLHNWKQIYSDSNAVVFQRAGV